jgi:osmoprotectant transport system permease protein
VTPSEPLLRWDWIASHVPDIAVRIGEHLVLAGIAVGVGFALAFALALLALWRPWLYTPIVWATGTMYTIPSLGLFALLIPFTGLTIVTAEIGLVGYTLLILVRNIVTGIRAVPDDVLEAATAMGYTAGQRFRRIELPLATPAIVAGVRIATVSTIGLVTVTAIIGQGGLGALILDGLILFFSTPLIVGAVLSVALAVVVDAVLSRLQRRATPWTRTG